MADEPVEAAPGDARRHSRHDFPRTDFPPSGSAQPYAGFAGSVGQVVATSESWWPSRPDARGKPNVIVILVDDVGFSDLGCYGGEIATPHLDRLAADGLRFSNFHVTPMCSPTRAAMLTGQRTGQAAGVGHVCHSDPGFPGYLSELADDLATMPEILRANGYATLMVGKWHLAKDTDLSDAGPRHSWPLQKGFDRYYGFLDGFTNFHQPHRLVEDNHTVEVDRYPDGYYLTDDLNDRAIRMIKSTKSANPAQPFFLYLAHGAAHAPLQAKPEMIARYQDAYTVGWDVIRERRFARAKELGLIPDDAVLPPRNTEPGWEAPAWDSLGGMEQEVFARYMAVYAAMITHVDDALGVMRAELEAMGEWDNTIVLFTSDNGASREGGTSGTTSYYTHLGGEVAIAKDHARLDLIGGPQVLAHYPQGWAMACNTPFRLYKTTAHQGGRHVPFIASWPQGLRDAGVIRPQLSHVGDLLPTLLDVLGIEAPDHRDGLPLRAITGHSLAGVLDDHDAPAARTEALWEVAGHRGYQRDNWEVVAFHTPLVPFEDSEWELYDLDADPTESNDLAAAHPERVDELSQAWWDAAWDEQILPLDSGSGLKYLIRPERSEVFEEPVTIPAGTHTLERLRSLNLLLLRSCTFTVSLDHRDGDRGMLVAHGDQGGGYALYVDGGHLRFVHNDGHGTVRTIDAGALPDGTQEIEVELHAPGGGVWTVIVRVDGSEVAREDGFKILFPMAPFEGIDVGIDRRSPVSWEIYEREGPFPYTGTLRNVRYVPGERPPDSPMRFLQQMREFAAQAYD